MKKKKSLIAAIMILTLLFVPACNDTTVKVPQSKAYDVKVDYIGNSIMSSENVKNITKYESVKDYIASEVQNSVLWIEDSVSDFDVETVRVFMHSKDRVIILSNDSKNDIIGLITDEALPIEETQCDESSFLGVMFVNIADSEKKSSVGLFADKSSANENIDFLAFCSEYDYKSKYQNENMITEYQKTQKLCDIFNVYNSSERVYAVSYATIVDFTNNPTQNANKTKYMYTLWNYTDVIPVNNSVAGFDSIVDVKEDSYVVSYSPESDREIIVGENVSANFFYGRYYTASYNTPSEGCISALYKGYGDVKAGWKIALTKGKKKTENYVYDSVNLTGVADIISLSGSYTPSCDVVVDSTDAFGNKQELTFGYNVNIQSLKYEDANGKD